jgi:26S proteasome regulatory subunit T3
MTVEVDSSLYTQLKALEQELEFLQVQEDYIKDEQKNLKRELVRAQEEVKRIQSVPLVIGQVWQCSFSIYILLRI